MGSHVVNVRERANTGGGAVGRLERKSKQRVPGGGEKWREGELAETAGGGERE